MKKVAVILFLLLPLGGFAQIGTPAKDPGLAGQYKRMVATEWDDWQPTPDLNWIGLPKNYEGWLFWRVINRGYWKGEDKRPMRAGGPFDGHLLAAQGQRDLAEKEKDTVNETMKKTLATDLSMSVDLPYDLYFRDAFAGLFNKANEAFSYIQLKYPEQWRVMEKEPNKTTLGLQQFLEITKDRIATIHQSYLDRGSRMIAYFKILRELEGKVDFIGAYCSANIRMAKLPNDKQMLSAHPVKIPGNDKQAVRQILKTWNF